MLTRSILASGSIVSLRHWKLVCLSHHQLPRTAVAARTLATAVNTPAEASSSKPQPKRREALDDGLSFDDFLSGEELPAPGADRVTLGNTSQ